MSELLESAWDKGMDAPMTTDEAIYVWTEMHRIANTDPDGNRLLWLFARLEKELGKGKRCGVCGRYESKDCWTDC